MIQRIQSVYLLLVAGIFIALFFLPLATVQTSGGAYTLNVCTLKTVGEPAQTVKSTWQLSISATVVVLVSVFTVFLYKNRRNQRRMCTANLLWIIVFCLCAGIFMYGAGATSVLGNITGTTPTIWVILPVIAFVLNIMAMSKIGADEKLVRSLDRIR